MAFAADVPCSCRKSKASLTEDEFAYSHGSSSILMLSSVQTSKRLGQRYRQRLQLAYILQLSYCLYPKRCKGAHIANETNWNQRNPPTTCIAAGHVSIGLLQLTAIRTEVNTQFVRTELTFQFSSVASLCTRLKHSAFLGCQWALRL